MTPSARTAVQGVVGKHLTHRRPDGRSQPKPRGGSVAVDGRRVTSELAAELQIPGVAASLTLATAHGRRTPRVAGIDRQKPHQQPEDGHQGR